MASQLSQQENILYQDDTVQVFRDKISILKYYFPIPAAKNIDMVDVQAVHLRDNVDGQLWGTSPGHMDTWFALDNDRHLKKQYLEIAVRGSDVKAAFSPSDPKKVMAIIDTNSSLLKAENKMKQEAHQLKEEAKYTSEVPQQSFEKEVQLVFNQPQLREPPVSIQSPPVVEYTVIQPKKKSMGQSIKEKINEKVQGLKNVKDSLKEKYEQGKMNAYVSPDNRIEVAKQNVNQSLQNTKAKTGEAYKEAGKVLQDKGNQMQYEAWKNS